MLYTSPLSRFELTTSFILHFLNLWRGHRGCDRMVVGFTITYMYAIPNQLVVINSTGQVLSNLTLHRSKTTSKVKKILKNGKRDVKQLQPTVIEVIISGTTSYSWTSTRSSPYEVNSFFTYPICLSFIKLRSLKRNKKNLKIRFFFQTKSKM
jgi:hypothetical protein